jgi:serine/threonine protein kinase
VRHYETLHGPTNVYIVNELLPFDLFDFMSHYKEKITTEVVAVVLRELLEALQFLQSKRVAHRDLKPENVLLEVTRNEIVVKLCDFNLCALLPENSSALGTFVGSPGFFAPEALLTPSFCAFKADVFSFGCIALELLTSSKFFSELWIAAYSCLQTVEAPLFSQTIRRATQTAHSEVVRLHCKTNAYISDVVIHALALQPALRASAAALRANVWICKASKFAAADLLNGRQQRKFIDVPSTLTLLVATPSVSGQLERAPTSPSAAAVAAATAADATGALNTSLPSPASPVPGASRKKSTQFALSAAEPDIQVRSPATTIKLPSSVLSLAASNITQRSRRRLTVTGNVVAAKECCASAVVTPPPLARRGTLLV